jgi:GntR family transcriptional regulator, arabinose operon transcriptional repressor
VAGKSTSKAQPNQCQEYCHSVVSKLSMVICHAAAGCATSTNEGALMSNHKYRQILEKLQDDICSGHHKPGGRLPSESELVRRFGVSRMTVFRAMRELQTLGLINRRVGSGTFVSSNLHSGSHVFGLLIPELGQTEIFEGICKGMMEAQEAMHHSLLWGNSVSKEQDKEKAAEQLCEHYISRKVSGVFFAPVEYSTNRFQSNHRIVAALDRARIPVVLLDRCLELYPRRSKYDLVGIDNRRAGYLATEHLIRAGAKRIAFYARPDSAPTVDARIAGYREALQSQPGKPGRDMVIIGDTSDQKFIRSILKKDRPDAFVCANDLTAGDLMHTLISLGRRIPQDIRIVGIDDVKYARLLPVPLTTLHQPCRDLGRIALAVMLDRIANPDLPPRDILLRCELIVRKSCGIASQKGTARDKIASAAR